MTEIERKPLKIKSYGSIAHLPGSRIGPSDRKCHEGQKRIATEKPRDRHDEIIVQEKLDGSNVGVAKLDGKIYALTRVGYLANTSPYPQHHEFDSWVNKNLSRFDDVLKDGERLCGEWLIQAHGTRYNLPHEPLVVFDLMIGNTRTPYDEFIDRVKISEFVTPKLLHRGKSISIEAIMGLLNNYGFHGAIDEVEGAVWRIERNELINRGKGGERQRIVDFLVKYVRPDKIDGHYLPELSNLPPVFNSWMDK
ncbi:MAG: RNA ligase family protein [Blastocatellia bacterium]